MGGAIEFYAALEWVAIVVLAIMLKESSKRTDRRDDMLDDQDAELIERYHKICILIDEVAKKDALIEKLESQLLLATSTVANDSE